MKGILVSTIFCLTFLASAQAGDTIKIMPVGNSITAGEHYLFPALCLETDIPELPMTGIIRMTKKIQKWL